MHERTISPAAFFAERQVIVPELLVPAWVLILGVLVAPSALGSAQTIPPHEHQGIIPAYQGAPPSIRLTAAEKDTLRRDQSVYRVEEVDGNVHAVAIFPVNAPPACVWSLLLDFPVYTQGILDLLESELYRRDGHDYYVKFRYRHWLLGNYTYYVRHTYPGSSAGWGTWTLDYSRRSDLHDSVGFWRVEAVAGDAARSRVFYSAIVRHRGWSPWWLRRVFAEGALSETSEWVREQSEQRWNAAGKVQCVQALGNGAIPKPTLEVPSSNELTRRKR